MKTLLFLFLFIGCAKEVSKEVAPFKEPPRINAVWTGSERRHFENIDVLVAFLWPSEITSDVQRRSVETAIATARKLKPQKAAFMQGRRVLLESFARLQCECALNGICREGESDQYWEECSQVEEDMSLNNQKLVVFYQLVEQVKASVLASGGEWLATNIDYPLLPASRLEIAGLRLVLEVFGDTEVEGEATPLAYDLGSAQVSQTGLRTKLKWRFPHQRLPGEWIIDVGVSEEGESLLFQGDLYYEAPGVSRRGIIQWEHNKI